MSFGRDEVSDLMAAGSGATARRDNQAQSPNEPMARQQKDEPWQDPGPVTLDTGRTRLRARRAGNWLTRNPSLKAVMYRKKEKTKE